MQTRRLRPMLKSARVNGVECGRAHRIAPIRAQKTVCQLLHGMWVGGAEVLAARLARKNREQYRFVFACLDELGSLGEELRDEGFLVEVIGRRPGLDWRCPLRLAEFFRRNKVDVIHAHQYTPFFYGITARLLYPRGRVLFLEHGRHFPDFPRKKRMLANRLLLQKRDRVIGVGKAVQQALIDNEGIPVDRVSVIYNGVALKDFAGHRMHREEVRRELGLNQGDVAVFQVARLDYLKDHATALRSLKRVVKTAPHVRLFLIGEGPERETIETQVRELGLQGHVHLLGLRNDVARLLPAADIFLLTSISEGIPVTLIEAMAASLPVLSTNVGGVAEVVDDEVTGLLAPSGDDARLAEQVLKLTANEDLRRQMGQRGSERAHLLFSETQMHASYRRLYGEMLLAR